MKVNYKKTRRGCVGKICKEVYLRQDISCGLKDCQVCMQTLSNYNILEIMQEGEKVFILDESTIFNQMDVIENCPTLVNVVIFQTIVQQLQKKKPNEYNRLKNITECETYRRFFVFADQFSQYTYTLRNSGETQEQWNERQILNSAIWYNSHLKKQSIEVVFITNSFKQHSIAQSKGLNSITLFDYINQISHLYQNLLDFLGFTDQNKMELEDTKDDIFKEHLDLNNLMNGIKKGEIMKGKLKIERNNLDEGSIMVWKYNFEIKIYGKKNLNRAMSGDVVGVVIDDQNLWEVKKNYAEFEEQDDQVQDVDQIVDQKLLQKILSLNLIPTGKVVGVVSRVQRNFCGNISSEIKLTSDNRQIRQFLPVDTRYPNFYLITNNGKDLEKKQIQVSFNNWPSNSEYPICHFKKIIGDIGNEDAEGNVILLEHNVEYSDFSKAVYECLPKEAESWKIPEEEIRKRLDLRHLNVCSVDPEGCKDIDDALHCIQLPNGNFQVGVHIADVTYFVRGDTPIDREAANRCTTVYLVNRRTDMLPKLLTETLCSLKSNVDRLAFSVIWEMNSEGDILSVSYGKTVINSKASLTYKQASDIINKEDQKSILKVPLIKLNQLAQKLNQKRLLQGALTLSSTQVKFTFDQETQNPTDVSYYTLYDTNKMIEEFMLLANIAVAQKIIDHFPSVSILRKHDQPKPKQIQELQSIMSTMGYQFDHSSNKNLANSLDNIKRSDQFFNTLIRIMTTRAMNEAIYVCTADIDFLELYHYGLAAQLYTHFTSPIRRYADVLVHRLLAASLDIEGLPNYMTNKFLMGQICDKMNFRTRNARFASRASSDYHIYLFFQKKLKELENSNQQLKTIEEVGIICSISKFGFNVLLKTYGFEGMIKFTKEQQIENEKLNQTENNQNPIVMEFKINDIKFTLFDYIKVRVAITMKDFHKQVNLEFLEKIELKDEKKY